MTTNLPEVRREVATRSASSRPGTAGYGMAATASTALPGNSRSPAMCRHTTLAVTLSTRCASSTRGVHRKHSFLTLTALSPSVTNNAVGP